MSVVLSSKKIMSVMTSGSHGSTFGGNPLACKLAIATLDILYDERLIDNSKVMGEKFRKMLCERLPKEVVTEVRGKGLMNAIVINNGKLLYKYSIKVMIIS